MKSEPPAIAGGSPSGNFIIRYCVAVLLGANGVMRFVKRRSVFTLALAIATVIVFGLFQPTTARADDVTLTSGSVVLNCPGLPRFGDARIDLAGPNFSLIFTYFARPEPNCAGAEQPLNPVRFEAVAFATFQGIRTQEMTGFLFFDETSLTGFIEGRDLHNPRNILFTVNFTGAGIGSISITRSTFQVVPEPTTLALLATGAALSGAARRLRSRKKAQ